MPGSAFFAETHWHSFTCINPGSLFLTSSYLFNNTSIGFLGDLISYTVLKHLPRALHKYNKTTPSPITDKIAACICAGNLDSGGGLVIVDPAVSLPCK